MVSPASHRFPRQLRVRRGADFADIIRRGAYASDDVLVVNVRRSAVELAAPGCEPTARRTRLGVSIPKKTGSAVVRNRWKRWIREAFRTLHGQLPPGLEVIVRPKRDAIGGFSAVTRSLATTVRRAAGKLPKTVA